MKTKRFASLILAAVMAFCCTATASAESFAAEGAASSENVSALQAKYNEKFGYITNPDGKTVTLIDFSKKAVSNGKLKIPSKIDGKKVTVLSSQLSAAYAESCKKIKVLYIPKTVKTIDGFFLPYYYYIDGDLFSTDGLKILCYSGTAAEKFAARHNIRYQLKDKPKNHVMAVRIKNNVSVSAKSIKISWEKMQAATGYRVYRLKNNNKAVKIADVKANTLSYKDTKCSTNKDNYYIIKAFRKSGGKKYFSKSSTIKGVRCMPAKAPKINNISYKLDEYGMDYIAVDYSMDQQEGFMYAYIYDPEVKAWSEPMWTNFHNPNGTCDIYQYTVKQFGKAYTEDLVPGKEYKIRLQNTARVIEVGTTDQYGVVSCMEHLQKGKSTTKTYRIPETAE